MCQNSLFYLFKSCVLNSDGLLALQSNSTLKPSPNGQNSYICMCACEWIFAYGELRSEEAGSA